MLRLFLYYDRKGDYLYIAKELEAVGLSEEQYEACLNDIQDKLNGVLDIEWQELRDKYNIPLNSDTLRKCNGKPFGGAFVKEYMEHKSLTNVSSIDIDEKLAELRREKIKLQTLNIERSRLDRNQARQELFYEHVHNMCETLPLPDFKPMYRSIEDSEEIEYCLALSDLHYGSTFKSQNNEYSREIFSNRLEFLANEMAEFINKKQLNKLHIVCLGDALQGLIHISDLKINDTEIVKCVVEVSRLIAWFLNELSQFCMIEYYHVPRSNHSQLRPLGTRASEIADEDLEYVISNYIMDLCANNERINVHLANDGDQYIALNIPGNDVIAMHGHQIKNIDNAIRDLNVLLGRDISTLLLGHYHNGKEIPSHESSWRDCEVLISPSFVGSDPYSDSIMKGSKAACKIYGFDYYQGHIETYKIILN